MEINGIVKSAHNNIAFVDLEVFKDKTQDGSIDLTVWDKGVELATETNDHGVVFHNFKNLGGSHHIFDCISDAYMWLILNGYTYFKSCNDTDKTMIVHEIFYKNL